MQCCYCCKLFLSFSAIWILTNIVYSKIKKTNISNFSNESKRLKKIYIYDENLFLLIYITIFLSTPLKDAFLLKLNYCKAALKCIIRLVYLLFNIFVLEGKNLHYYALCLSDIMRLRLRCVHIVYKTKIIIEWSIFQEKFIKNIL